MNNPDDAEIRPAVIVLDPRKQGDPFVAGYSLEPTLDQGRARLPGRLWLTNEALAFGHFRDHTYDGAELFEWVLALGLGDRPTIMFDPGVDGGELRYYSDGFADLGAVQVFSTSAIYAVDWVDVERVIREAHIEHLVTPQQQLVKTWSKASAYWASNDAEAVVQNVVKIALKASFLFCEVEKEGTVQTGRYDLTISRLDPMTNARTCYGVLELKVLKSHGYNGGRYTAADNASAVEEGLRQAYHYRSSIPAIWAALCCFDARKEAEATDDCFDAIASEAQANGVHVASWRLHNSPSNYRRALSS